MNKISNQIVKYSWFYSQVFEKMNDEKIAGTFYVHFTVLES